MTNVATLPAAQIDTRYTQDLIPILDTSKFEHMQRVAMAMAIGSTIPESLRRGKINGKEVDYAENVVVANCFRVVNQAVRWGFDPFAVMDCVSLVHGRMMYEGKLVAAVIDAKLGVALDYEFFDEDKGKQLGVRVFGTRPGETKVREVEGRVADWHKGDKSPWVNPADWKRQLRYRGAREWARAHAPAVLLGVYTEDEFDGLMSRDVPSGARALRAKDVTPKAPLDELPDIPDEPPQIAPEIESQDPPIADVEGFLAKLKEDRDLCESEAELAELIDGNCEIIDRLPAKDKAKAKAILEAD